MNCVPEVYRVPCGGVYEYGPMLRGMGPVEAVYVWDRRQP